MSAIEMEETIGNMCEVDIAITTERSLLPL